MNRIVPPKSDQKSIQNGNAEKPRDSKRHRLSKEEVVDFGGDTTKHQALGFSLVASRSCCHFLTIPPISHFKTSFKHSQTVKSIEDSNRYPVNVWPERERITSDSTRILDQISRLKHNDLWHSMQSQCTISYRYYIAKM